MSSQSRICTVTCSLPATKLKGPAHISQLAFCVLLSCTARGTMPWPSTVSCLGAHRIIYSDCRLLIAQLVSAYCSGVRIRKFHNRIGLDLKFFHELHIQSVSENLKLWAPISNPNPKPSTQLHMSQISSTYFAAWGKSSGYFAVSQTYFVEGVM